jgi:phosphatidylinositol glycan class N
MTPHSASLSENEIPSNRVVIMALDGVRADVFFETIGNGLAPFLKDIVENRGVYGVSHTKVPTETKPNFIAMFSGHFSDASLALKDLYSKKVPSDSIFNESNHAWGIGVDACIFREVATQMECVPFQSVEDFSDNKAEMNNYKIFDTMIELLNKAKSDKNNELYKNLNKKKISFLFHIIQTDTIGHKDGPKSQRFVNHLSGLDSYYKKLEKAFNDFYQDNKTTFIITADHGMDDRKAHGDGHPDCTRTPYVVWGAGIRKAIKREKKPLDEDTPSNWNSDHIVRRDISQIDMAPLFAGIMDINIPMNSLGIIPLDIIDTSDKVKSKMIYTNLLELYEIYNIKNNIQSKSIVFKPFQPLIDCDQQIKEILKDINKEKYIDAINKTQILINKTLAGMDYILHYDRAYLKTVVVLGYILWSLYIFTFIEMKNKNCLNKLFFFNTEEKLFVTKFFLLYTLALCYYLYIRISPITYYLYTLFPCYFFWRIISNLKYLKSFFILNKENKKSTLQNICNFIIVYLLFLSLVSIYNNYFSLDHYVY